MENRTKLNQMSIITLKLLWMLSVATTVMYLTRGRKSTGPKKAR
jgi:hypothetical protein